jgi:hypothetical protein
VVASKQLFADRVMPFLRPLNIDTAAVAKAAALVIEVGQTRRTGGQLPLYPDFNYTITRDSPEVVREFVTTENGKAVAGWEMRTPEREPGGFPCQIIFAGPTAEHRGSAIRLSLKCADGISLPDDAGVTIETMSDRGTDRQSIFAGKYRDFARLGDQHAPDAAIAAQRRAVANDRYIIRLTVSVASGGTTPDPAAADSFFELECFKHWVNVTA